MRRGEKKPVRLFWHYGFDTPRFQIDCWVRLSLLMATLKLRVDGRPAEQAAESVF